MKAKSKSAVPAKRVQRPGSPVAASRRRGAVLEEAIINAAWAVLTMHGYSGFTYEAIAAEAGTSRPVLYRRWPESNDLLFAAVKKYWHAHPVEVPDTGNVRDDAITLLRKLNAQRPRMMALVAAQLMDSFRTSGRNFQELRESLHPKNQRLPFEEIVDRAIARGQIAKGPRISRLVNLPTDLLRHEVFMTMKPVPDAALVQIVDELWLPLLKYSGA